MGTVARDRKCLSQNFQIIFVFETIWDNVRLHINNIYIYIHMWGSGVLCGKIETISAIEIAVAFCLLLACILLGLFFEGRRIFLINPHQTTSMTCKKIVPFTVIPM